MFLAFWGFIWKDSLRDDREQDERERRDDMQRMAAGRIWALGCYSEDTASVYGKCTLSAELLWHPQCKTCLIHKHNVEYSSVVCPIASRLRLMNTVTPVQVQSRLSTGRFQMKQLTIVKNMLNNLPVKGPILYFFPSISHSCQTPTWGALTATSLSGRGSPLC